MLYCGDALAVLGTLPEASVQCCVTSPPYWGLRDYGVTGQLGLERTPEEYVEKMVAVFRAVRRVLRNDATLWLNLGDSYAGSWSGNSMRPNGGTQRPGKPGMQPLDARYAARSGACGFGTKPKDLVGIPWRLAFALQADGWWLRSDIIWSKPNPMPESVRDRPTRAHEYLFLLAKGQRVSRVVEFADLAGQRVHLGKYLGAERPDVGPHEVCVVLATTIFDRAQQQEGFGLPPFNAQEWKQRPDSTDSDFVRSLPPHHVPAVWAARFLDADATAKEFLEQLNRLRFTLRDRSQFLVGGVSAESLDAPAVYGDGERTVTVHHAGKISKIEFAHQRIVVTAPTTCKYYYDAAAIAEPAMPKYASRYDTPFSGSHPTLTRRHPRGMRKYTGMRNSRSVWTIATDPYPQAHFATFSEELARRCILAGSRPGDCVLDPFGGSGTVAQVATGNGRSSIYIDLNPKYLALAQQRIGQLLCEVVS